MARPLSPTIRPALVAVVALLGAATVLFWTTGLDLAAADLFRTPCCSWPLADRQPWSFIYRYGVFAGVLLAGAALVTLTLSYWYPRRLLPLRRPALFLVLVVAIGPGLLVNVVFKDHYGRPRPREVVPLGGQEVFLPVWVPGSDAQAKSFPCGHCSMGFYLGVPWLLLKRRRRRLAWAAMAAGLLGGGLLGVARMMAGGHFLSDVVWSGGMTWLVALGLYQLMDLDRPPEPIRADAPRDRRSARLATLLGGGALGLLTVGVLLATPYVSSKTFTRTTAQVAEGAAPALEVVLGDAAVQVSAGPDLEATYQVQAFGLPTSRVRFAFTETPQAAVLALQDMGVFTERRTAVALRLPASGPKPVRLRVGKGRVELDLAGFAPGARLDLTLAEGEVRVRGAEAMDRGDVTVRVEKGAVVRE
jgi:membrane-associated PAP2 superfamily phosphatase